MAYLKHAFYAILSLLNSEALFFATGGRSMTEMCMHEH